MKEIDMFWTNFWLALIFIVLTSIFLSMPTEDQFEKKEIQPQNNVEYEIVFPNGDTTLIVK